jgi:hypothetical protein
LSIDDVSFEHVTLAEANQILKNCVGEFSRVEILPLSQMAANKAPSSKSNISFCFYFMVVTKKRNSVPEFHGIFIFFSGIWNT